MTFEEKLLKVILHHFELYQARQEQAGYVLSPEASAKELRSKVASLEVTSGVLKLNVNDGNNEEMPELEEAVGNIVLSFIDATVAANITSDLQGSIDRVLSLVAAFGISYSINVANLILSRALEFSEVLLERVRGHACILLGKIADTLMKSRSDKKFDEAWIDGKLGAVGEALFNRLQDKGQSVRCHALKAAGNFFAATNEDVEAYEELLDALLWNMAHDPAVSCRVMAVQIVAVNSVTMDALIARVRDVKSKVRAEALQVLYKNSQAVPNMTESQLVELIRSGLTNRCGGTREAASKMICSGWMKSLKYDPIALLKKLGVTDNEEEANQVLDIIMEAAREADSPLLEELSDPEIKAYKSGICSAPVPLIELEQEPHQMQPEQLFFLRALCKNVMVSTGLTFAQKDSIKSKLIPNVPLLCEHFEKHTSQLMKAIAEEDEDKEDLLCFVSLQLLQLALLADINEEGSRRNLARVMQGVLSAAKTPYYLIEGCINALRLACDNEADLLNDICAIISKINNSRSESSSELETIRILSIISVVFETTTCELSLNPAVKEFAKYIVPSVTHQDGLVREAAIGCFGKLGLFTDKSTIVSELKPILLAVASCEEEKIEIRAQSLMVLADWSILFSETLSPCHVDSRTLSFPVIVREMMNDSRISTVCISAEVSAKLLFSGRVCDSEWFAKLLTIFFDPRLGNMTDDCGELKEMGSPVRLLQLLSVFFPAVSFREDSDVRDAMMGCVLPLLELVYLTGPAKLAIKGKKSGKKVDWPIVKMINYILALVGSGRKEDDEVTITHIKNDEAMDDHNKTAFMPIAPTLAVDLINSSLLASLAIAEFLAKNLEENLTDVETRALTKILGALDFDEKSEDIASLKYLKQFMEDIGMALTDAKSLGNIETLNAALSEINVDDEDLTDIGIPKSGGAPLADNTPEYENKSMPVVDLSDDLMKSLDLDGLKISRCDQLFDADKENCGEANQNSKVKSAKDKNSAGSAASRLARARRLADAN